MAGPSAPIITLLTDFGLRDSYVAEVKAVLLGAVPAAQLVDITHDVPAGDLRAAQYLLGRSWHRFPPHTVHLAVVDPGVGTARRAIAASRHGHWFVAPDNGILTPVLDGARVIELAVPPTASPTFHARDVFAPAAARLATGEPLERMGLPVSDPVRAPLPTPRRVRGGGGVAGTVVYVDRFGTLITDLTPELIGTARVVTLGKLSVPIGRTFGDVATGEAVAFIGSGGTLEIAVRDGSAAEQLQLAAGTEVRVT